MKTTEERVQEVFRRVQSERTRRFRRTNLILSFCSGVSCVILLASLWLITEDRGPVASSGYYGSSLLIGSAGGYVLVAVVAFVAAVSLTMLYVRLREHEKQKDLRKKETDQENLPD